MSSKTIEKMKFENWKTNPLTDIDVLNYVQSIEEENKELHDKIKEYQAFFSKMHNLLGLNEYRNRGNESF